MLPTELSPSLAERLGMEVAGDVLEAKGWELKGIQHTTQAVDKIQRHMKVNKARRRKIFVSTKMGKEAMKLLHDRQIIIKSLIR